MLNRKGQVRPSGALQGAVSFTQALVSARPGALADWLAANTLDANLAAWLAGQGLAPLAFYRLRENKLAGSMLPDLLTLLQRAYYRAVADAALHGRELAMVLRALAGAGIVPMLFKGAVLAYTAYPSHTCRPMGDLDLWLDESEMSAAQAAIEQLGYVQRHKINRPAAFQALNDGEIQLIGSEPGSGLIELHFGVFAGEWLRRTAQVRSGEVQERVVPVTILGQPAKMLAAEDAMIQLALHLAVNHQFAYPWVRGLVDMALLARTQTVDWNLVADRARAWRVATPVWLALSLADTIVGLDETRSILPTLAPSALQRRILHLFVSPRSLLQRQNIASGPLRLLLLLAMVDRLPDALRLLGRAIWPEEAWLSARYGLATRAVRRHHLLSALRGQV